MTATRSEPRAAGLSLGRPLGIPVLLSPSVLVLAVIVTAQVAEHPELARSSGTFRFGIGLLAAVFLATSILLHELGHSAIALALGIPIKRITLFVFGGVAEITREPDTAAKEYLVSIAGPLVSLTLGALGLVAMDLTSGAGPGVLFGYLAFINLLLGFFNLLPGLPLDGGRVLRAGVWQAHGDRNTATRVAARSGMGVGVLLGGLGAYALSTGDGAAVITLLIALFIFTGARTSLTQAAVARRLPQVRVRDLVEPALEVPADLPLAEALRRAQEAQRRLLVVDADGIPAAVISAPAVEAVPAHRRPWVTVGSVSRSLSPELTLPVDLAGEDLLTALRDHPASEYLVVEGDGSPVGVLAARDVVRRLGSS
ncbi:MAG TPA: M50 family metallopeptidase [Mycobacteriales bacterium]|nr:M50 family metallopeptidase [Mycobacteriales bacterium]